DTKDDVTLFFNQLFFNKTQAPKELDDTNNVEQALTMFPEFKQSTVQFDVDRSMKKGPVQFEETEDNHYVFSTTIAGLKTLIKDQIDSNHTVWLAYDHHNYYVDGKTGAMSIKDVYSVPQKPYILRDEREEKSIYYGGHAVQVIGYVKNEKGDPVAFIIQNSWSEDFGQKGLEIMDSSYFGAYVFGFTTRDRTGKLVEKVKSILDNPKDSDKEKIRKLRMMPKDMAELLD
ncbi:MAG: hypothetical protein KDD45_10215, partial [Bdellovibrionales bacterium]|nr:hypothetical protein [Bdellovibrionales bacterium]